MQNIEFLQHRLNDYCQSFHKSVKDSMLSIGVIYLFLEVIIKPFISFLKSWKIKHPWNKQNFREGQIKINQDLGSLCQWASDMNYPHSYSLSSPLLPCPLSHSITVTLVSSNIQAWSIPTAFQLDGPFDWKALPQRRIPFLL